MNKKKWIRETRDWLERDRSFSFQEPQATIFKATELYGKESGSVSVELMSLSGYVATLGVHDLLTGASSGWMTLKSAFHLFRAHVRVIEIGDEKAIYRTKYVPVTPNKLVLGNMIGLLTGLESQAKESLTKLWTMGKRGRLEPDAMPLFGLAASVAEILAGQKPSDEKLVDSGRFRAALEGILHKQNVSGVLHELAEFHRSEVYETEAKIGLFAWEPFDFFPIELIALIKAANVLGSPADVRDELLYPEFFTAPVHIEESPTLQPLLNHLHKLVGDF